MQPTFGRQLDLYSFVSNLLVGLVGVGALFPCFDDVLGPEVSALWAVPLLAIAFAGGQAVRLLAMLNPVRWARNIPSLPSDGDEDGGNEDKETEGTAGSGEDTSNAGVLRSFGKFVCATARPLVEFVLDGFRHHRRVFARTVTGKVDIVNPQVLVSFWMRCWEAIPGVRIPIEVEVDVDTSFCPTEDEADHEYYEDLYPHVVSRVRADGGTFSPNIQAMYSFTRFTARLLLGLGVFYVLVFLSTEFWNGIPRVDVCRTPYDHVLAVVALPTSILFFLGATVLKRVYVQYLVSDYANVADHSPTPVSELATRRGPAGGDEQRSAGSESDEGATETAEPDERE